MFALQSEYLKSQLAALQTQAKEFGARHPEERDPGFALTAGALESRQPENP